MMAEVTTIKCPICGEPYKVYAFFAGDQSACSHCQQKAMKKGGHWTHEDIRKGEG